MPADWVDGSATPQGRGELRDQPTTHPQTNELAPGGTHACGGTDE
ncbi:hypothetical protein ACFWII_31165 [Streptomyces sp. NPDC127063]